MDASTTSDATGQDGGTADAASCTPSTTACQGDNLVSCDASGVATVTPCLLGCNPTPTPECRVLSPTNLLASTCETAGGGSLTLGTSETLLIDTSLDALPARRDRCNFIKSQPGGAPEICIVKFDNVTIPAGAKLSASGNRVLAIVATGRMNIGGTIDVGAEAATDGPGGATSAAAGEAGSSDQDGGGGGGNGFGGGSGARGDRADGPKGGRMIEDNTLSPLRPGGRGGSNGATLVNLVALGGGAGGGLQLVSCGELLIGQGAVIDAGGGRGQGGRALTGLSSGGGGGGSGGNILIEAARVTISGTVVANGGGGGEGSAKAPSSVAGMDGADGSRTLSPAPGGNSATLSGGEGGAGGARNARAGDGQPPANSANGAGGGGGAVGRIRIHVRVGTSPTTTGAVVSPAPVIGAVGTR